MNTKEDIIAKLLTGLAECYNTVFTDSQLEMYVDDLMDMDINEIIQAIKLYRRDPKNTAYNLCPPTAKLRAILRPTDDAQSREVVSRIIYALKHFNDPYQHTDEKRQRAREYIGELGWRIVQRYGGWASLSNLDDDAIGTTAQAHWRELASSMQVRGRLGILDEAPSLPGLPGAQERQQIESSEPKARDEEIEEPSTPPPAEFFKPVFAPIKELTQEELKERQRILWQQGEYLKKSESA